MSDSITQKNTITFTPEAAVEFKNMQQEENAGDKILRLFVQEGGCSGWEYGMTFCNKQDGDICLESQGISFIVDPNSNMLLSGSVIHYDNNPEDPGFDITNPNAHKTCGCGKSFS